VVKVLESTWVTKTNVKIEVIHADNLSRERWLVHGFSTRSGGVSSAYREGDLNLGHTEDDSREAVERNRRLFMDALGAPMSTGGMTLVSVRQIHSDIIHRVDAAPAEALAGDGLVTTTPHLLLTVRTADCYPVIIADIRRRAVGVFHAGWRGTLARIVEKGVGELRRHFESRPEDIQAAIGPGIGNCCYKVGEEVREKFTSRFAYADAFFHETEEHDEIKLKYPMLFLTARAPGHSHELFPKAIHLDLAEANRRQLAEAGVPEANITVIGECTSCDTERYFSHRKEQGKTGRMMAAVGIKNL
jgi:polyphenol oxidase